MLEALLTERFRLALHRDHRTLSCLVLAVSRSGPKLQRTEADGPGILRPGRGAMIAQHATMSEFVTALSGPLRIPVIVETGLTARYDFTVDLSSYLVDAKPGSQPDIIRSALREQLGLNLEPRKEPVEFLVINHAEKSPLGN